MANNNLYPYQIITSAIYYEVIELMGEEGLESKLTAYDLLAVMAAPCTRIDYDNTESSKRTPLIVAVHSFMSRNQQLKSLTYRQLVAELNRSFVPSIPEEKQQELITSYKMVMGFDADGYAIFNDKYYNVYKGNMDKGNYTKIVYGAISSTYAKSNLPDKEIVKTFRMQKYSNGSDLGLDISTNDWIDILRGASEKAMQLIGAYSQMRNHTASHSEIEAKFGIIKETINGVTAGLGNRAKRILGIEVLDGDEKPCCWVLPFKRGKSNDVYDCTWELRQEVFKAYEYLMKNK